MTTQNTAQVHCQISRGGFSGERVVRLATLEGAEYAGVVSSYHCFRASGERLTDAEPASGERLDGRVEALLLRKGGPKAMVELPNGEAVWVPAGAVLVPRAEVEYVPLGA